MSADVDKAIGDALVGTLARHDRVVRINEALVKRSDRLEAEREALAQQIAAVRAWFTEVGFEDILDAILASVPPVTPESPVEHRTTQTPPWPPFPGADYMLTQWACICGWHGEQVVDARSNRDNLDAAKRAALSHVTPSDDSE